MSAALALHRDAPVASLDTLAAIATYARTVDDPEVLKGLTARIGAARELAKMQDDARDIRRMLMHAEAAILVRRSELKDPKLSSWDKRAVRAFLRAGEVGTRGYIDKHFEEYGKAAQLGRALHAEQDAEDATSAGEHLARSPQELAEWHRRLTASRERDEAAQRDESWREEAKEAKRASVARMMRDIVDGYTYSGEPFSVEDVTDALVDRMGGDHDAGDAAFRDGMRRVCREAVRAAGVVEYEGERLPSTIAVETDLGWVRVPLGSATPAHLADTIRERERQIERDRASVDRLSRFLHSILVSGCGKYEPIADYLPASPETDDLA